MALRVGSKVAVDKVIRMLGLARLASGPASAEVELARKLARTWEAAEPLPSGLLLHNTVGRELSPCKLLNRLDRSICRNDYRHRSPGDWDGRSIVLVLALELGRQATQV